MWLGDSFEDLGNIPGPVHLAIGTFDGLHRGHAAVIGRALEESRQSGGTAALLTFQPHPLKVLAPDRAPPQLTSFSHRLRLLRRMGVHHLLALRFDRQLAALTPREFIARLARAARPLRHVCVGHEWSFGHNREGNIGRLRQLGADFGFAVDAIAPVLNHGETISSTAIRSAVTHGDLARAAELLGRPFAVFGRVVPGQGKGRRFGFPTANLELETEVLPPDGVYAVRVRLDGRDASLSGVANLGVRPTVEAGGMRVFEVHLFDTDEDLYGAEVEAELAAWLRPERRFASTTELIAQIRSDTTAARDLLAPSV